jgi:hypothetical protein
MNKLYLMKNPEVFQGEKYLIKNKNYFEGWYFKNSNEEENISFIPGINIYEENAKAFIQVITNQNSYFVNYDIKEFEFSSNPFYIKIKNNFFSKDGIKIDIKDRNNKLNVYGELKYSNSKNIGKSIFSPNIMGPFSYIPFMECNHAILSMKNTVCGSININGKEIEFKNGTGYIEKDWGSSFPKSYIWCQGNNFKKANSSFMLSVADIPFKLFNFRGIICDLIIDDKEFKFTTYNNAKLIEYKIDKDFDITLKKENYKLNIKSMGSKGLKLSAPVKGKMDKDILESISSKVSVTLKENNKIIFSDTSKNCGVEIVNK